MSRRNAGANASLPARRARSRLQATLGDSRGGLLDTEDGSPEFMYDGSARPSADQSDADPAVGFPPWAGIRWRLGIRVAVLLGIVSILVGGWFWWQVSAARPDVVPLGRVTASSSGPAADAGDSGIVGTDGATGSVGDAGPPADPDAANIVVHMTGAVKKAGVVELPKGSRIHQAITAAGGSTATADLNRLNLAAVIEDGQKIHVPQQGEVLPAGEGSDGGGAAEGAGKQAGERINLNTAGVEELGTLPRVGPVLAQRIVDWRKEHGTFKTVEELDAVDGVGPKMLETLLPLVSV
ncbi:helix-hairpin-helix domain-containing protein [Micrococcaceae bacterium Sec5.7]